MKVSLEKVNPENYVNLYIEGEYIGLFSSQKMADEYIKNVHVFENIDEDDDE